MVTVPRSGRPAMLACGLLLALSGCSGPERSEQEAVDELSVHEDQPCPGVLAHPARPTGKEFCTGDLGPRLLVVTARDNDLTGYVVDAYGCGDIRMTDDPFTSPPGVATQPRTVSGVLRSDEFARAALRLRGSPR